MMGAETKSEHAIFYLNVGTVDRPQWECINPSVFEELRIELTVTEKIRRFIRKLFALFERWSKG